MGTPMDILLPKLGFSMNEATLIEWLVPHGSVVQQGEPLFTFESEKSTQEVEAPASGKLRTIAKAGEVFEVGAVIGVIE